MRGKSPTAVGFEIYLRPPTLRFRSHSSLNALDRQHLARARSGPMIYRISPAVSPGRSKFQYLQFVVITALLVLPATFDFASGQTTGTNYQRELDVGDKVSLSVKSRNGRVSVIASDEQKKSVTIEASSAGATVDATAVHATAKGNTIDVEVRDRGDKDRIDVIVHIPVRSKVNIETQAGSVDIVGNFESATVRTNTGTIHADVPLEALKFNFVWSASKPRYLSDVELPKIKEKAAGVSTISGTLGEEKPAIEDLVLLDLVTQRGVVLLNVDPSMVPTDLRERPLTEAARAIVRSGDSQLI